MICPGWQPAGTCSAIRTVPLGGPPGAGCGGAGCSGCGATLGEIGAGADGCGVRTGGADSVSGSASGEP